MNLFKQIAAVTGMNLRSLPSRWGSSLVVMIGIASVVAVVVSLLAINEGITRMQEKDSRDDRVIVTNSGTQESMGTFTPSEVAIIAAAPGVKNGPDGKPLVQPQGAVIVEVTSRNTGAPGNVMLRGSGPTGFRMSSNIRVVEGRMFRPGVRELVVGRAVHDEYLNMNVGDTFTQRGSSWTIVGVYDDDGGIMENALVGDADTVRAAFDRPGYQSVSVMLTSPAAFRAFKDALTSNPQLSVEVRTMRQYYANNLGGIKPLLTFVTTFIGGVMAVGAVFGALTSMYAAVDGRTREIATLRAIGFGSVPVVVSVMVEAVLLALPAALIGAAIAWVLFNNDGLALGGVRFKLAVTPVLVAIGAAWALGIGLIGGFAPAIKAARVSVASALRGN